MRAPIKFDEKVAHPAVLRFLREYRENFSVIRNPNPEADKWVRFSICQPVKTMQLVDESIGLCTSVEEPFPVGYMPQCMEIDQRVLHSLHANRFSEMGDPGEDHWENMRRIQRDRDNEVEAWAKDVGYWHFKKSMAEKDFNFALIQAKDPLGNQKRLEDQMGRELR